MIERSHGRGRSKAGAAKEESDKAAAEQSAELGSDSQQEQADDEEGTKWRDPTKVGEEPVSEGWTQDLARDLKQRSKDRSMWVRLLFMVLSTVIFLVVYTWLVWFVVIFQFLSKLLTGKINSQILAASDRLVSYAGDLLAFLLYRTEQRPWPFGSKKSEE